jgi:hypothetical protein
VVEKRCRVRKNGGALWGRPKPTPDCTAEEGRCSLRDCDLLIV